MNPTIPFLVMFVCVQNRNRSAMGGQFALKLDF